MARPSAQAIVDQITVLSAGNRELRLATPEVCGRMLKMVDQRRRIIGRNSGKEKKEVNAQK